ncbi:MAG: ABC transporter ATP-binding protein [Pseudomonadota bacterium]
MTARLSIEGLEIRFRSRRGDVAAVRGIDLEVAAGEILGVVGESGAGKSTIGNAAMGLIEPPGEMSRGTIRLEGEVLPLDDPDAMRGLRGDRIAMIFQDPQTSLNPLMTIADQLVETMRTHLPIGNREARRRAESLLDQVGIPDPASRMDDYPHQFSGGMRQRVVIALALCADPEMIIADEPTTALDVSIQAQILGLLRGLVRERGVGMILITHDMGVIAETADRVAVMYRGDVVEVGPTAKILREPEHDYTRSLIAAVPPSNRRIERFPVVEYIEAEEHAREPIDLVTHWLGRERDSGEEGDALEIEGLSKVFRSGTLLRRRDIVAVDDVSFTVRPGESFGIVGESGSGKSTIARLVTGLYPSSGGAIRFGGADLTQIADRRALNRHRRQIQMIFQDPYSSLNPRMQVGDIVAEPIFLHGLASDAAEAREIVADLLEHVGLGRSAALRFPHEFSGGQRQRISIARALATRPRFLICDEPTSALDVSIQAQILNLLKDLQEELRLTLLFISHDLPVIRQMCDRVGVMKSGRMLEVAETEQLFKAPQSDYSRHLLRLMPGIDKVAAPAA